MANENYENKEYAKDVKILKKHLHKKLWRTVPEQYNKWLSLISSLCALHKVAEPRLRINPEAYYPYYDKISNTIVLNKYSVISLLHELGHAYGFDEAKCVAYSEKVFLTAYPKAKEYLVRDDRGYLVKTGGAI